MFNMSILCCSLRSKKRREGENGFEDAVHWLTFLGVARNEFAHVQLVQGRYRSVGDADIAPSSRLGWGTR